MASNFNNKETADEILSHFLSLDDHDKKMIIRDLIQSLDKEADGTREMEVKL